jgi:hypothetical protein
MYTSLSAKMIAAKNTFFRRSIGPGRPNVLEMKRAVTAEETLIVRRKKLKFLIGFDEMGSFGIFRNL